eukprot:TRINITY_DN4012_c0_g1_i3.p2 TRINITY_DN4012_c0_g1~~TRINITY_DN4012_c0_g1_i3.p2  ORF type:complete len:186 (+),score=-18.91 TRINITY_DN4012_c0_g1_i3:290-847(+)
MPVKNTHQLFNAAKKCRGEKIYKITFFCFGYNLLFSQTTLMHPPFQIQHKGFKMLFRQIFIQLKQEKNMSKLQQKIAQLILNKHVRYTQFLPNIHTLTNAKDNLYQKNTIKRLKFQHMLNRRIDVYARNHIQMICGKDSGCYTQFYTQHIHIYESQTCFIQYHVHCTQKTYFPNHIYIYARAHPS